MRNLHTVFHGGYTNLHFHQQSMRFSFSPHSYSPPSVICCCFFYNSHFDKWYLIVVLIFISLMISDTEHLFIYMLAMCMVFFGTMSIQIMRPFFNQNFLIYWVVRASLVAQLVENPPAMWETWINPWVGKIPWRRPWQPTINILA